MAPPGLTSLWLGDFKSHHEQALALHPITLLVGRNGGGKSSVLDAFACSPCSLTSGTWSPGRSSATAATGTGSSAPAKQA